MKIEHYVMMAWRIISLRSKGFKDKNVAKQIQLKLCLYGCILGKYTL